MNTSLNAQVLPIALLKFKPLLEKAGWMWPIHHQWDLVHCFALFRKTFTLKKITPRAELLITADQSYQLYINETYVCRGPARGYQANWPCDVVDIAPFLQLGKNIICIRAYNPGLSTYQYLSQGSAGVLLAGKVAGVEILSDRTWLSRRQEGLDRDMVTSSSQLFSQESIDLRLESQDWTRLDWNPPPESWVGPRVTQRFDVLPWPNLSERGIPLLKEEVVLPKRIVGQALGTSHKNYKRVRNLSLLRYEEGLEHEKKEEAWNTLKVSPTKVGRFVSYILDFGHLVVGSPEVSVSGAQGGELVDSLHFETMNPSSCLPDFEPKSFCFTYFSNRLTCRPGVNQHRFYHPWGSRYVLLTFRDVTKTLTVDFKINNVGYPLEEKGAFKSSDSLLEKIWATCVRTQKACSLDAYVDTPWREQAQWWGDARVQAWNTFHLNGDARLFRRGISQIAAQTTEEGLTYGHAPTKAHGCVLPDFTLIWMITLWDYWWQTGSIEAYRTHVGTVKKALGYFENKTDKKNGFVPYDKRFWLFLDWTGIFKDGYPAVYQFWLLIAISKLQDLALLEKDLVFANKLTAWENRLKKSLLKLKTKNGLFSDGLDWGGRPVKSTAIHTQVMAMMTGLASPKDEKMILEQVLLPHIRGSYSPEVKPSAYWLTYVFSVLSERGYEKEVIAFIKKHWEPMAEYGSTFELFDSKRGEFSFSHAWSAHPLYHLMQTIGGITQTSTHWKSFQFKPVFFGESGGTILPTPLGNIKSSWLKKEGEIKISLQWPKKVQVKILLPGLKEQTMDTGKFETSISAT